MRRRRQTTADARTPNPLAAQCSATGANRVPVRRRSSARSTPARAVPTTVAHTTATARRRDVALPATAVLVRIRARAGRTCQTPNRTDDTAVAATDPYVTSTNPHTTPPNAHSSSTTVDSGITTRPGHTPLRPAPS